jgi:hypothetical protein
MSMGKEKRSEIVKNNKNMQLFLKLSLIIFRDNHTIGIVSEIVLEKSYNKKSKKKSPMYALTLEKNCS